MTPEQVKQLLDEFQETTRSVLVWRLFESPFGGGSTATSELCNFLADKINSEKKYFDFDPKEYFNDV